MRFSGITCVCVVQIACDLYRGCESEDEMADNDQVQARERRFSRLVAPIIVMVLLVAVDSFIPRVALLW